MGTLIGLEASVIRGCGKGRVVRAWNGDANPGVRGQLVVWARKCGSQIEEGRRAMCEEREKTRFEGEYWA